MGGYARFAQASCQVEAPFFAFFRESGRPNRRVSGQRRKSLFTESERLGMSLSCPRDQDLRKRETLPLGSRIARPNAAFWMPGRKLVFGCPGLVLAPLLPLARRPNAGGKRPPTRRPRTWEVFRVLESRMLKSPAGGLRVAKGLKRTQNCVFRCGGFKGLRAKACATRFS